MRTEISWKQLHDMHGAIRTINNGGRIESDIHAYNRNLKADGGFSENRRRADRHREEVEFERSMKEVWDE